ncbi:MAG TPA: TonB-dependent receptor plug domain-containing protein, partial [Cytophagaceae bacterium]
KMLPAIGGEVDVVKVLQLMPGVQKGNEGGSGMFVRGGTSDQNLILLDEATVYNPGHLFGFFSIFNNDALKDVQIIKGGFPASYGGRLSSVLDIKTNEGNNQGFKVDGGIGMLSSRATLQGPIIKDRMSFILSARRTYLDKVLKVFKYNLPYYFYDLNAKINYKLSDKNTIFFSTYFGKDVLNLSSDTSKAEDLFGFGFKLGNYTNTVRWNHTYNKKLFSNVSIIHTNFSYNISGKFTDNAFYVKSKIDDLGVKGDWEYYLNAKNQIRFGASFIHHNFRPNIVNSSGELTSSITSRDGARLALEESGIYLGNDQEVSPRIKLNYGLRFSSALAKSKVYSGLEPRVAIRYTIDERSSIKASYSRMKQYMHLVSSSSISLPTDLWYPVTESIKPQVSDQVSLGYFLGITEWATNVSVEAYYKKMNNLIEYKEGAKLMLNDNFDRELLNGKGNSYGLEFLINKSPQGKFSGWASYTISWATRQFDELNKGEKFFAKFDRRHNLSLVGLYKINDYLSFSAVWVFASGSRFTPVVGQYAIPNASLTDVDVMPIYASRNSVKMSPSHRLDLNLIVQQKKERRFKSEWHIGCYNLYNQTSPYKIEVVKEDNGALKYQQKGLFGFLPSLAYNFKF